ncbi:MAG: hypothetical protein NZ920_05465 [Aigarchaeota archaeon]|nr:hypothetical protein [Aigarchaeota archaeon]MDW8092856.1 hypothetical protein [Nitrososphaerota archaeon]
MKESRSLDEAFMEAEAALESKVEEIKELLKKRAHDFVQKTR